MRASIFENLFVLGMANNHWGHPECCRKIIADYAKVVRFNRMHAAVRSTMGGWVDNPLTMHPSRYLSLTQRVS